AKMQSVISGGDWTSAWLLTGLPDPLHRKEWAGTKEEMAIISGYQEAVFKLKKKVAEAQKQGEAEEDDAPATGTLLERSGSDTSLFPCALPYPEVLSTEVLQGESELSSWWARAALNTLVAWSNYVTLGCPSPGSAACEPRVGYRCVQDARLFADRLLGELEEFGCSDLVLEVPCAGAGYPDDVQVGPAPSASSALPVVAERVAVPAEAGRVDPLDWLPADRAEVVASLEKLRRPEHLWDGVTKSFHNVPEREEADVAERLLATQMAVLVPEAELPRDSQGCLLTGGLFSVPKNSEEDRLIYDRRPENGTMPKLDWARVLGMGDVNGCAIAQGVYLDDLLITAKVRLSSPVPLDDSFQPLEPREDDEDVVKVKLAEEAYDEAGLQRAVHKEFRMLTTFRAWGAHVDGVKGRVGAPLEVRRQVWKLISAIVRAGR
ncbi:unnamed protein product, partial [Symbiodinium necroappetens]